MLCWIGIAIVSSGSLTGWKLFVSFISPIFIILLLLFVSGIPLLEQSADKKYEKDD